MMNGKHPFNQMIIIDAMQIAPEQWWHMIFSSPRFTVRSKIRHKLNFLKSMTRFIIMESKNKIMMKSVLQTYLFLRNAFLTLMLFYQTWSIFCTWSLSHKQIKLILDSVDVRDSRFIWWRIKTKMHQSNIWY